MKKTDRREFFLQTGYVAAGFAGLQRFLASASSAAEPSSGPGVRRGSASGFPFRAHEQPYQSELEGLGKLVRDPLRVIDLPEGFSYKVLSVTGDPMDDGLKTPGGPDGMAAFAGPDGRIILVRNHELEDQMTFEGAYGVTNANLGKLDPAKIYDSGKGVRPQLGGTTTLVYNPESGEVERKFLSLAGTTRNCAGGPTPWGTWITCEESVVRPKSDEEIAKAKKFEEWGGGNKSDDEKARAKAEREKRMAVLSPKRRRQVEQEEAEKKRREGEPDSEAYLEKWHGYNFEVPASNEMGLADPVPLKQMGRFNHEAIAVEPESGIIYQTEDRDDGLITRFLPTEPGNLRAGGRLQALVIKGNLSCDTRNWPTTGEPTLPVGEAMEVEWMDLEDLDSPKDDLRTRAYDRGAAIFARGEGMWHGNGKIYFACTSGGVAQSGQIFIYEPSPVEGTASEREQPGRLTLFLEPNNVQLLQYGDNLTVSPWGDVVLCEDGPQDQYLRGITRDGRIYTLGRCGYEGDSEMCGCCFAPDHPVLFVNIQRPGITLAITGPWEKLAAEAVTPRGRTSGS
ncbi:MAG: DUF839 domain-containing protein [Verrucomicrobiae bacterium]|nr:DUF839 domain-containing protein [Verrucomicrobiae bacterium]